MADSTHGEEVECSRFIRGLFNNGEEGSEDDDDSLISEHVWTCPDSDKSIIYYHLAHLAPGHGNSIWNSSECIAKHLLVPEHRSLMLGNLIQQYNWPPSKSIEFGAGAALPSLALLKEGATRVVFTDRFVNEQTFDALRMSVDKNAKLWGISKEEVKERVKILAHTWGEDVERLAQSTEGVSDGCMACENADLVIASDCIYNPTYHRALLQSVVGAMDKNIGLFIVGYSFHSNVPKSQTLNFFEVAKNEFGLHIVSEITNNYDGQRGIGSTDAERGVVYVKVLAFENSVYCTRENATECQKANKESSSYRASTQ